MNVDELAALLEGVPCHEQVQVALRWNGHSYATPLVALSYRAKLRPKSLEAGPLYLLPQEAWLPLSFDVWKPSFRVKP